MTKLADFKHIKVVYCVNTGSAYAMCGDSSLEELLPDEDFEEFEEEVILPFTEDLTFLRLEHGRGKYVGTKQALEDRFAYNAQYLRDLGVTYSLEMDTITT